MSEKARILGAVAVGTLIILMAFLAQNSGANQEASVINAQPRPAVETTDIDGDGVPDWEQQLSESIFNTIQTPPSLAANASSSEYVPPTTLTGRFSEAFMQDFLQGKIDGKDFSDPTAFIENAVGAIEKNTVSKRYTTAVVFPIPTTKESAHTYGNALQAVIALHSPSATENEMVILNRALTAKDPELLAPLTEIRIGYESIIEDTLAVPVPDKFVTEHIALLNAYEGILTDIRAAEVAFTDPLYTLARVRDYDSHVRDLLSAFVAIAKALAAEGVVYRSDEPGAFYRPLESL